MTVFDKHSSLVLSFISAISVRSLHLYQCLSIHNTTDIKPTLFPTEEGALIDLDAADGFAIAAPPTINTTAVTIEEELSPSSSSSSTTGPIRRKTMQEKELLRIYYQQIGPNAFPPRSETASRWRWAIKKVRTLYRLKRFKFGFTRQRYCTVHSFTHSYLLLVGTPCLSV